MSNEIKFTSFYNGVPVLWTSTPYSREEIVKELLASELGEWAPGYYRFVLIEK